MFQSYAPSRHNAVSIFLAMTPEHLVAEQCNPPLVVPLTIQLEVSSMVDEHSRSALCQLGICLSDVPAPR